MSRSLTRFEDVWPFKWTDLFWPLAFFLGMLVGIIVGVSVPKTKAFEAGRTLGQCEASNGTLVYTMEKDTVCIPFVSDVRFSNQ